jgi:hypothetical protein
MNCIIPKLPLRQILSTKINRKYSPPQKKFSLHFNFHDFASERMRKRN